MLTKRTRVSAARSVESVELIAGWRALRAGPDVSRIRVWDRFVRVFHWTLVAGFALAYWTSRAGMQETHVVVGYALTGLVFARILWGVIGPTHARFSDFWYDPREIFRYLGAMLVGHPRRYLGHSPAAGAMVLMLLGALVVTVVSGVAVAAVIEFEGPLVGVLSMPDAWAYALRRIHTVAVNVIIVLVVFHVVGVLASSVQHRENLVRAMITGWKRREN